MADSDKISSLAVFVPPVLADYTVTATSEAFLLDEYAQSLSLPVVDERGRPLGTISRYRMMDIFFRPFGRELHGKRPVSEVMDRALLLNADTPLDKAGALVTSSISHPVTEDFFLIRDGEYYGAVSVMALVEALQDRLAASSHELSLAYGRLKASHGQLVQTEKMASLGQMVAGLAHEINTPLGYVRNNLELVREQLTPITDTVTAAEHLMHAVRGSANDAPQPGLDQHAKLLESHLEVLAPQELLPELGQVFDDTLHGVDRIAELILNLKNFARLDQADTTEANINALLDSALTIAGHLLKNRVQVQREYGELPPLSCAPSHLNQVFLNMLSNAAQAIEGEGRILIRTWADDADINIVFQDSGKGIEAENLKKIFDPFFTTKPVGQGTGMGLSISYQIVRQHGGRIRVGSKPGVGTKFHIQLPVRQQQREEPPDNLAEVNYA
ncbi:MAG: ATP-binding protein [Gammaproteobacteria bacterium]